MEATNCPIRLTANVEKGKEERKKKEENAHD